VSSSIYINQAIVRVAAVLPDETRSVALDAVNGRGSAFVNSLSHHNRERVTYAIIDVLQVTFYVAIFAGSLSSILAFCMRYKPLEVPRASLAGHFKMPGSRLIQYERDDKV
jgi:hypothetical protein